MYAVIQLVVFSNPSAGHIIVGSEISQGSKGASTSKKANKFRILPQIPVANTPISEILKSKVTDIYGLRKTDLYVCGHDDTVRKYPPNPSDYKTKG